MRRRQPRTGLIVVLCGFTAGVVAQAACRPPAPIEGAATHDRMTVIGCVTSLYRTVGTDGHQTGLSHRTRYMLTMIGARARSTGVVSTAGAAEPLTSAYWLDASDSQVWSYVGNRVEVQGTALGNRSASSVDSESEMKPARIEFRTSSGRLREFPVVKVESVRLVAPGC
jgi:hypothetical protein